MYPILIIREEIICLVILLFIILSSSMYKMGKDQGSFLRICLFAVGHVIFDLITVITVNNLDIVPARVNWICHLIFYLFALLFSYEFFCYTVERCYSRDVTRKVRRMGLAPLLMFLAAIPFLPMYYLEGNGTNYSYGAAAIVGYGVAMFFFIASIVIVLKFRRRLDPHIVGALLPMLSASVIAEVVQIAVPELLFTGGAITIITVGFFFSLENPVAVLRQKVLYDALTGVKSRHAYDADIVRMEHAFSSGTQYGMAFFDINDLKAVNDTRGHMEGDVYIGNIAQLLMSRLKNAEAVYRMGGDEFLAAYKNTGAETIRRELESVKTACEELSERSDYMLSVASGFAVSGSDYKSLRDVLRMADYEMYSDKARIKKQRAYLFSDQEKLNITGLTDRIFDAFELADSNRFLFVMNMTTNVTRLSHVAAEYLGLPGDFVYDCNSIWLGLLHPEDRDSFFDDTMAVFSGKQKYHDMQYRIKNANGDYVVCSCVGTVLRGKNGEPDLFAGSMKIQNIEDSVDRITDLRNGYEMINCFNRLISTHAQAALLKIGITNLNRINMLYGYVSGNDILRQFAAVMRGIVGSGGSIFRVDGTKFVICVPGMTQAEIAEVYHKIRLAAEQRIQLDSFAPPLQIAGGAYMLQESFEGNSSILRSNILFAYTQSKYESHGRLVFYDAAADQAADGMERNKLLLRIHQDAIQDCSGFSLSYQPIVSVGTGKIIGAEALLRWSSAEYGTVQPDSFIPWLEGDPCFFRLGNWILKNALLRARPLLELVPGFTVNINIAMQQLEHESFRDAVTDILRETGFPPSQLCLELTERCRELDIDFLKGEIEFFRSKGIRIALDDLGTGFSSFGLLLSLDVDEVKLDYSFVREIQTKRVNQILTRMIIEASNSMGYTICLEGVEDDKLCAYLDDYGATYYQGYYCARPLPMDEFETHMRQWNGEKAL